MKRLLLIGFAACAFALAPTLSASAMPVATPGTLGASDAAVIQVKGGKGHGWKHHGGHGHHYGWFKKRHHQHWIAIIAVGGDLRSDHLKAASN